MIREAILKKKSKYGHCPNWLNLPPLIWAVAEHFYAKIATFWKMQQNSVKFHIDGI